MSVCLAERRVRGKRMALNAAKSLLFEKGLSSSIIDNSGMGVSVKLMKSMGWEEGKGLGADLQGMSEPLAPTSNVGSRGIGYDGKGKRLEQHSYIFEGFEAILGTLKGDSNKESGPKETKNTKKEKNENKNENVQRRNMSRSSLLKAKLRRNNHTGRDQDAVLGSKAFKLYKDFDEEKKIAEKDDSDEDVAPAQMGFGFGFQEELDVQKSPKEEIKSYSNMFCKGETLDFSENEKTCEKISKKNRKKKKNIECDDSKIESDDESEGEEKTDALMDSIKNRYSMSYQSNFVAGEVLNCTDKKEETSSDDCDKKKKKKSKKEKGSNEEVSTDADEKIKKKKKKKKNKCSDVENVVEKSGLDQEEKSLNKVEESCSQVQNFSQQPKISSSSDALKNKYSQSYATFFVKGESLFDEPENETNVNLNQVDLEPQEDISLSSSKKKKKKKKNKKDRDEEGSQSIEEVQSSEASPKRAHKKRKSPCSDDGSEPSECLPKPKKKKSKNKN